METLIENEAIGNIDFSEQDISGREYVKCNFENCNFTKTILKNTDFFDCSFSGCNFSLAALTNTGLKGVKFSSCKLMGVDFGACSDFLFSVTFIDSHLDYSSFHKKKMKKKKRDAGRRQDMNLNGSLEGLDLDSVRIPHLQ